MKKNNVIGHMITAKETAGSRFRRLHLVSRFVCLLLAVLIWLVIVNMHPTERPDGDGLFPEPEWEQTEQ